MNLELQVFHLLLQLPLIVLIRIVSDLVFPPLLGLLLKFLLVHHDVPGGPLQLLLGLKLSLEHLFGSLVFLPLLLDLRLLQPDLLFEVAHEVFGLELHLEWQMRQLLYRHVEVVGPQGGRGHHQGDVRAREASREGRLLPPEVGGLDSSDLILPAHLERGNGLHVGVCLRLREVLFE